MYHSPDLVFLNETAIFQHDVSQVTKPIGGEYCYSLNSEDNFDPELPLFKNRSHGGTMILWKRYLDPFITPIKTPSSSFLPILMDIPGSPLSCHVSLYLPTSGRDSDFVENLSLLTNLMSKLTEKHPGLLFFIRGDSNANPKNQTRKILFQHFQEEQNLKRIPIGHNTYHHFTGGGLFDSEIDVILQSKGITSTEVIRKIICKLETPQIDSHHDVIISEFLLPASNVPQQPKILPVAPRILIDRRKVIWSDSGKQEYQQLVSPHLQRLRKSWNPSSSSKSLFSVIINSTNHILSRSASSTNKSVDLNKKQAFKSTRTPQEIASAQSTQKRAFQDLQSILRERNPKPEKIRIAREKLKVSKKNLRKTTRRSNLKSTIKRDEQLHQILSDNPSAVHSFLKSSKNSSSTMIQKLTVGEDTFTEEMVPDGFFQSMSNLKSCNFSELSKNPALSQQFDDYEHIRELCNGKHNIPSISRKKSDDLLRRIRKNVKDLFCITALHYIYAGEEGLEHFNFLLNLVIDDIGLAEVTELNVAHGLIIYKGHGKDKNNERSYCTISTCPFLAKSLDLYVKDLYIDLLEENQAPTQYFGSGSSHELASLLVTETVQFSINNSDKPVFLLFLDARSAFDKVLPQLLVKNLFSSGLSGSTLSYIDSRLRSRSTVYEWDKNLMGPAKDDTGVEQGGVPSGDFYKVHNNEQLKSAQSSMQGVDIGSGIISGVGQADDVLLTSNDIYSLQNLVHLTSSYCHKYSVQLCADKTKLLAISSKFNQPMTDYSKGINPIQIDGVPIKFTSSAEHVGVIRSTSGNLPNILNRISSHKNALGATLSAGLARAHRGNPAASLRIIQLYSCPVLISGLASLFLTPTEFEIVDNHFKVTLENVQKLHQKSPAPFIYFMAGSLPASAVIHQRQLSLFSMICRLPDDPLYAHALVLAKQSTKSWFHQIRNLCLQYNLPHPLQLLDFPPSKSEFKRLVKARILDYWEANLRALAAPEKLPSLKYFHPHHMSLSKPHPLWLTAGSSPYEVNKASVQARMLSGRFRTEKLCSNWSSNPNGFCLAPTCTGVVEDIEHILLECSSLEDTRARLRSTWLAKSATNPFLHQLLIKILVSAPPTLCQFLLDPSTLPEVIALTQIHGDNILRDVFYLTRTWCYSVYKSRQRILGRPHFY